MGKESESKAQKSKQDAVRIVLVKPRKIGTKTREPAYVLLEGITAENVTFDDVVKALATGDARMERA